MIHLQFARFAVIGGIATAVQYAILVALVRAGMPVLAASSIGFVVSATVNYGLNKRYTFGSDSAHARTAPRFAVVAMIGLLCNNGFLALFHELLGLHYLLSQLLATIGTLFANFLLNRMWTFAPDHGSKAKP